MKTLALLLLLIAMPALGCNVDADCPAGAQCVKPGGQPPGICKGAAQGEKNRLAQPPNDASGAACTLDADCGESARCSKRRGQEQGVCVNRR
jgi:hypothetical protein